MAEIDDLKKELAFYKNDPEKRGYFAIIRIVNQQVDYLNDFNIKNHVGGKASEDATFSRTKDMWENLPKMISALNDLKVTLRISKKDEDEEKSISKNTTPESIANVLGHTAGQRN